MDITDQERIERLEKEVTLLRSWIEIYQTVLMNADRFPILSPGKVWDDYSRALAEAKATAGL